MLPYSLLFHALYNVSVIVCLGERDNSSNFLGSILIKDQSLSDYLYRHLTVFIPHCPAIVMQFVYQIFNIFACLLAVNFPPPLQFILDCLHLQGSFCLAWVLLSPSYESSPVSDSKFIRAFLSFLASNLAPGSVRCSSIPFCCASFHLPGGTHHVFLCIPTPHFPLLCLLCENKDPSEEANGCSPVCRLTTQLLFREPFFSGIIRRQSGHGFLPRNTWQFQFPELGKTPAATISAHQHFFRKGESHCLFPGCQAFSSRFEASVKHRIIA